MNIKQHLKNIYSIKNGKKSKVYTQSNCRVEKHNCERGHNNL